MSDIQEDRVYTTDKIETEMNEISVYELEKRRLFMWFLSSLFCSKLILIILITILKRCHRLPAFEHLCKTALRLETHILRNICNRAV